MRGDCAVASATCQGSCVRRSGQVITCPALTRAIATDTRITRAQNAALVAIPVVIVGGCWLVVSASHGAIAAAVMTAAQLVASRFDVKANSAAIEGAIVGASALASTAAALAIDSAPVIAIASSASLALGLTLWPALFHRWRGRQIEQSERIRARCPIQATFADSTACLSGHSHEEAGHDPY